METKRSVFISFAQEDALAAARLKELLESDADTALYESVPKGFSRQALGAWGKSSNPNDAVFLSLWSGAYQNTDSCVRELNAARNRQKDGVSPRILFFVTEEANIPERSYPGHWEFIPSGGQWEERFLLTIRALFHSVRTDAEWVRCECGAVTLKKVKNIENLSGLRFLLDEKCKKLTLLNTSLRDIQGLDSFPALKELTFSQCDGLEQRWDSLELPHVNCLNIANRKYLDPSLVSLLENNEIGNLKISHVDTVQPGFWTNLEPWLMRAEELSLEGMNVDRTFFQTLCKDQRALTLLSLKYIDIGVSGDLGELLNMDVFPHLRTLRLHGVPLQLLPQGFSKLKKLEELELCSVPLRELTALSIGSLLPRQIGDYFCTDLETEYKDIFLNLKRLVLSNTQLKALPDYMDPLHLEELHIQGTDIKTLPGCYITPSLKSLYLSGTRMKELPDLSSSEERLHLEELSIPMSSISKLPYAYLTDELRVLNLSNSGVRELDSTAFRRLKSLEKLDLSHTRFTALLKRAPGFTKSLRELRLRGTNLTSVPDWVGSCKQLDYLDLRQLSLERVPALFARMDRYVTVENWSAESGGSEWRPSGAPCRILIAGLHIKNMDSGILSRKYIVLLKKYLEGQAYQELRRSNIILIGDEDAGAEAVAEWLTETSLREWRNGYGFRVTDSTIAFDSLLEYAGTARRELSITSLQGRFMLMDGQSANHLMHPLFMTSNSLYLVVLNGDQWDQLPQRALYWAKMIESYSSHSQILFITRHSGRNTCGIPLLEMDVWLDREAETVYLDLAREEQQDAARRNLCGTIVRCIRELMLYSFSVPPAWGQSLRHVESLLAVRNRLSLSEYRNILENYFSEREYYEDKAFRSALEEYLLEFEEKTVGQMVKVRNSREGPFWLYNTEWLAEGLYRLSDYARKNNGAVFTEAFWESLVDHADREYSLRQVNFLIEFCLERNLCYRDGKNGALLWFPCFAFEAFPNGIPAEQFSRIRPGADSERYTVRCPLMSRQMLNEFSVRLCRLAGSLSMSFCMVQEGVFFLLNNKRRDIVLVAQGRIGVAQELRIWFSRAKNEKGAALDLTELIKKTFEEWEACLEPLPEYMKSQYEITIARKLGDQEDFRFQEREELAAKNILGYRRAGRDKYFSGVLNREYPIEGFILPFHE